MGYLDQIKLGCLQGWHEHQILPSLSAAQAVIESGWGGSALSKAPYWNQFGIKPGNDWTGRTVNMRTPEYTAGGVKYYINADFRAYDSIEDSLKDHAAFFSNEPWRKNNYKAVVGERDYKKACYAVKAAGYATGPTYAIDLIRVIEQNALYKWDQEAFNGAGKVSTGDKAVESNGGGISPNQAPVNKLVGGKLTSAAKEAIQAYKVTVIGDGIAELFKPKLQELIPSATFDIEKLRRLFFPGAIPQGKQNLDGVSVVHKLVTAGTLGDIVVIHLGTFDLSGVPHSDVERIIELIGQTKKILFVDTASEITGQVAISMEYRNASAKYDNVFCVNWQEYGLPNRDQWYEEVGAKKKKIFPNSTGAKELAEYIAQGIYEAVTGNFGSRQASLLIKKYVGIENMELLPDGTLNIYEPNNLEKLISTRKLDIEGYQSVKGKSEIVHVSALREWSFDCGTETLNPIDYFLSDPNNGDRQNLLEKGIAFLKEHSEPKVQYTLSLADMPSNIRIGDTGVFIDHDFNPPKYIRARVLSITTSQTNPGANKVTIGNAVELYPREKSFVSVLQEELKKERSKLLEEFRQGTPITATMEALYGLELSPESTQTRLIAHLWQNEADVTTYFDRFEWSRISANREQDVEYNKQLNGYNSSALNVSKEDLVDGEATFVCTMYDGKGNQLAVATAQVTFAKKSASAYDLAVANGFRGTLQEWLKSLKGEPGPKGIPGPPGSDGKIQYIHVAYADNTQGLNFSTTDPNRAYIGTYVDDQEADSTEWSKYKWTKAQGPKGDPGKETKHHQAFAKDAKGTGFSLTDQSGLDYIGSYFDTEDASSTDWSRYTWTKKPEAIERDQADTNKQTEEAINAIRGEAQKQRQELEAKAARQAVDALIKEIRVLQSAVADDKKASEAAVANALNRVALTHNELQDMAVKYSFLDRSITLADEGLIVGNKGAGTYLRVADDRISFVNNGSEVAFISGNMLQFTQAIFTERIQVGEWLLSGYEHDPQIFVIRHVGRR